MSQREFSSWLHDAKEAKVLSKPYDCVSSPGTNRNSGVAIVYKSHFELSTCAIDQKGRFVCGHLWELILFKFVRYMAPIHLKKEVHFLTHFILF